MFLFVPRIVVLLSPIQRIPMRVLYERTVWSHTCSVHRLRNDLILLLAFIRAATQILSSQVMKCVHCIILFTVSRERKLIGLSLHRKPQTGCLYSTTNIQSQFCLIAEWRLCSFLSLLKKRGLR